jgi:hypothetical protein
VDEQDFWVRLEFRICAEFAGFADVRLRRFWCDGLVAEEYDFAGPEPCIRGRAWCGGTGQEPWRFTLVITPGVGTREEIDWSALLPSDGSTGWLSPHPEARSMTIDRLSGYAD